MNATFVGNGIEYPSNDGRGVVREAHPDGNVTALVVRSFVGPGDVVRYGTP